jgi:PEP-CTERM motif
MKFFLTPLVVLLCSLSAFATSYSTGEVAGFFDWESATNTGHWTPRIPGLPHYNGTPSHPFRDPHYMYPTGFSNATLSVTCNPVCAVGNKFSFDLTMSNFTLTGPRPYLYPGLNMFVGMLNLITRPIVLKSSNGIAMARFSLTGDLLGCSDATCANTMFSLAVNIHGYATVGYNLNGSQLSITSVQYTLPEPSSMILLGTGLGFVIARLRQTARCKST